MLDTLIFNFINECSEENAILIIRDLVDKNYNNTSVYVCNFFYKMFPHNVELLFKLCLSLFKVGKHEEAFDKCQTLLSFKNLGEEISNIFLRNSFLSIENIKNRYIEYRQFTPKITPFPLVTFTITTCKRYDLFEKSINSFLNCCLDTHLISKWICVDDNSNEIDRKKMREKYPFFQFFMKGIQEKGHPLSMNIIRDNVNTPYIFHMEDDWLFFNKKNYISECLEVLSSNPNIKQCLLNKNYSEIPENNISGGIFNTTYSGLRYYTHEYCETDDHKNNFVKKYGSSPNCSYWPHFSFRPSLFYTSIFKTIGSFDIKANNFEMDYAYRYTRLGYISSFLESINCIHIGRLTSERNNNKLLNAYNLNDEIQFKNEVKNEVKNEESDITLVFVVNLKNRYDRWKTFVEKSPILKYKKYNAVNGNTIQTQNNHQLYRIFDGNNYNMRSGIVGCAMSHIKLYVDLVNSNKDFYCILEDDIDFVPDFNNKLSHVIHQLKNKDWDMVYLGHFYYKQYITDLVHNKKKYPHLVRWNTEESLTKSMGGTFGYLISKKGSNKLLEYINRNGMTNAIDTIQQKSADILNIYYCIPHLVYSKCHVDIENVDSDIQHNFNSLTKTVNERLDEEKTFYEELSCLHTFEDAINFSTQIIGGNINKCLYFYSINILEIETLINITIHDFYTLDKKVIIFVTNPTEYQLANRNFDKNVNGDLQHGRLKNNNKFNINC